MKAIITLLIFSLLLINLKIVAQPSNDKSIMAMSAPSDGTQKATCALSPTKGNNVSGTVTFTKVKEGIKVVADVQGLTKGKHGFHIHDKGDCSAPDGSSAGGHFNPQGMKHNGPPDMERHAGDLGNLEANAAGKAHYEYVDLMISFEGTNSIIGKSIIVHEKADDFVTQPTGNSGGRMACGVIAISK
jgi:superoxide dismutase, Cu-Zn family